MKIRRPKPIRMNKGHWVCVPLGLLEHLSANKLLVLCYLVNQYNIRVRKMSWRKGGCWLKIKKETVAKTLKMDLKTVFNATEHLQSMGLLTKTSEGFPAKQSIKLNEEKIRKLIQFGKVSHPHQIGKNSSSDRELLPVNLRKPPELDYEDFAVKQPQGIKIRGIRRIPIVLHTAPSSDEEGKKNHSVEPSRKGKKPELKNGEMEMAMSFAKAIESSRKVNCTSQINSWAQEFRKMISVDKVDPQRLQEVLDWYCSKWREEDLNRRGGNSDYLPVAFSAKTFRKKFLNIELAMERLGEKQDIQEFEYDGEDVWSDDYCDGEWANEEEMIDEIGF